MAVILMVLLSWASRAMSRTLDEESSTIVTHKEWMSLYGRTYADDLEMEMRSKIFKDNVDYVEKFNKEGKRSYKLRINEFADLTSEEFLTYYTGYKKPTHRSKSSTNKPFRYENLADVPPSSIDWREKGAVTSIKNQGRCGT